ncbi:MAG: molecular chaperone DnaK [Deltaproteobacteria bacterium]|nr:molecular chaperone DnaK [Deltaproteobacteria bacterium]
MSDRIIGIDLGTTNSCVATFEGGEARVLANAEGARTTPSIVAFTEGGERLVGQIAKRQMITNPNGTFFAVKRLIGRRFSSPEVQRAAANYPYKIVENESGEACVEGRGRVYTTPEISSMVLMAMKATADAAIDDDLTKAVVTVPAYFDDAQRQATKDAGRIAGLDVLRIINEPTAAALAYGFDRGQKGARIAVYDLGGGTFDISILDLHEGVCEVRSTNGDTYLGGEDFDLAIVDHLIEEFQKQWKIDLRKDRMARQRLKEVAEKAKHELSSLDAYEVNLPFIAVDSTGPKHLNVKLTRARLEQLTDALVKRTIDPCEKCLHDAGLTARDIDEVVLVGGQTRMPRVQEVVKDFFGREPHRGVNPDEVVAVGAAIQGGVLAGEVKNVLLLDVTPLSLGVATRGGLFSKVIERNSTIPIRRSEVFSTAEDLQNFVDVHVFQGEREMADDNTLLGKFRLDGIPPAKRGEPQIEVTFEIDANGILHVTAKDKATGRQQSIKATELNRLQEGDIQRMVNEAADQREADVARKQVAELQNKAEGIIYTTQASMREYAKYLTTTDRENLELSIDDVKRLMESSDFEAFRAAVAALEAAAAAFVQLVYETMTPADGPGGEGGAVASGEGNANGEGESATTKAEDAS